MAEKTYLDLDFMELQQHKAHLEETYGIKRIPNDARLTDATLSLHKILPAAADGLTAQDGAVRDCEARKVW